MADSATGTTNTRPQSKVSIRYTDKEMWSEAQEFACIRLCTAAAYKPGMMGIAVPTTTTSHVLYNYNVRARRVSATYARFYLETEEGGSADKKGRFYWMALAAFAAKTVACSLEDFRVGNMPPNVDQVAQGLGKGNMWLFYDIAPWHWMHSNHADCMASYETTRSATNLVPAQLAALQKMPWSAEALPKIGNFKTNKHITEAFELVRQIERLDPDSKKAKREIAQMQHLMAIAEHEQMVVLQPLIYEDEDFVWWLKVQRKAWVNWATPTLQLVFSTACEADDPELKSIAPKDMMLEDFKQRFDWIKTAAKQFHGLMQRKASFMEAQLHTMASWVDMNDPPPSAPKPAMGY